MISFFLDGTIHGCNHHFALMLFGYTQQELLKKVSMLILGTLYQIITFLVYRISHSYCRISTSTLGMWMTAPCPSLQ
jgi:purine-cytosine permease-like protein